MTIVRSYASAGAFRKALEERLKRESRARQIDINRLRGQVSFDRLVTRLFRAESVPWVLKGGYVWIFFEFAIPASTARKLGCAFLTQTMERRHQLGLDSHFGDCAAPRSSVLQATSK